MNLLAFERPEQYAEVLNDTSFVKFPYKKWPTVGNEAMKKHAYTHWIPDADYVILLNMYKHKDEAEDAWVKGFKGRRLCVVDGGDKAKYWKPFIDVADIYLKENSYRPTKRKNVRIGCYQPSMKVPFLIKKHKIRWREQRKLDWMFCGDMHKARGRHLREWVRSSMKGKCGDEHTYGRPKYLEMMSKTKLCPSFKGYGDRARREWEALLCGGMLRQDDRLKGYPFVIMKPEQHFSFHSVFNKQIARAGYDLARECFMQTPSIDIRLAALYTFFDLPQLWSYEQVERAEVENRLR